jgi:flagellar biosynthesis/type III secretory pathway protein FliH
VADEFVPFERYVRRSIEPQLQPPIVADARPEQRMDLHDVRRFYAAVADAVDAAASDVMRDIASEVLARELALAPVELAGVTTKVLQQFACEEPLHVVAHRDDLAALHGLGVPVRVGESLRRGDVTLVLRYGSIDASLGARLADVLAR